MNNRSAIGNNPQAKEYVDAFLNHAVRPITAIFQITGHNRARQRDKWGHLLEELATLQDEVTFIQVICGKSTFSFLNVLTLTMTLTHFRLLSMFSTLIGIQ